MSKKEMGRTIPDAIAQEMIKNAMTGGMLLITRFSAWGNRKKVAEALLEEKFKDDAKVIRAVHSIVDNEAVRAITREQDKAKAEIAKWAMAWFHDATNYIPIDRVEALDAFLTDCRNKVRTKARETEWVNLQEQARKDHPQVLADVTFPTPDIIIGKFDIQWSWQRVIPPMGNGVGDTVTVVSKAFVDREEAKWREQVKVTGEQFIAALKQSLLEILTALKDTLSTDKKFYESTVEKPKEFIKKLLEVKFPFEDEQFKVLAKDTLSILEGVFAEDLRDDKEYRKDMGQVLEEVVDAFKALEPVQFERYVDF